MVTVPPLLQGSVTNDLTTSPKTSFQHSMRSNSKIRNLVYPNLQRLTTSPDSRDVNSQAQNSKESFWAFMQCKQTNESYTDRMIELSCMLWIKQTGVKQRDFDHWPCISVELQITGSILCWLVIIMETNAGRAGQPQLFQNRLYLGHFRAAV